VSISIGENKKERGVVVVDAAAVRIEEYEKALT
jgi:hypothetical protein